MTRYSLACCLFAGTAFLLAAMLIVNVSQSSNVPSFIDSADAGLVSSASDMIVLTAQSDSGVDSLFILDSQAEHLLIYKLDNRRKLRLAVGPVDIARLFSQGQQGKIGGGR